MQQSRLRSILRGSTRLLYDEFVAQNHPVTIIEANSSLLEFTDLQGVNHLMHSTCSDHSSSVGKTIASSKQLTAKIARTLNIPTPPTVASELIDESYAFFKTHQRVVVKPLHGSGGRGVSTNIRDEETLTKALHYAKQHNDTIVTQQHIIGDDVRLLVIGGKFCSAVIRRPAYVSGDGSSTVEQLIYAANTTSPRNDDTYLSILPIDVAASAHHLGDKLYTTPAKGQRVRVTGPANVSLGGSLHEATHLVTPAMIADAEAISQKLKLGICGVDIMWDRETRNHYLIEVNATPGIDIHDDPFSGTSSDCVQQYVQWLVSQP